jgi:hypothetical protein
MMSLQLLSVWEIWEKWQWEYVHSMYTVHMPPPPPKKKIPELLGQVNETAMCYTNPTDPVLCKLVVWRTPHFMAEM